MSQHRELVLIGRLHQVTWPSTGAKIEIRVRASAPTEEDPGQTFRGAILASVQFSQPTASPAVLFSTLVTGFPGFVDITVVWIQGQTAAAGTANISGDLSLKS